MSPGGAAGTRWDPVLPNGGRERGWRRGTRLARLGPVPPGGSTAAVPGPAGGGGSWGGPGRVWGVLAACGARGALWEGKGKGSARGHGARQLPEEPGGAPGVGAVNLGCVEAAGGVLQSPFASGVSSVGRESQAVKRSTSRGALPEELCPLWDCPVQAPLPCASLGSACRA